MNKEIVIHNITPLITKNKMPRENEYQVDIELNANSNSPNQNDVDYHWDVEYLQLDILNNSLDIQTDQSTDRSQNKVNFFFEASKKNKLKANLSIYKEGFYRITLKATDFKNEKEHAIILQIGSPDYPKLFLKTNIPPLKESQPEDFIGLFYLKFKQFQKEKIFTVKAGQLKDQWYETGIEVNPFQSFVLQAGTHLVTHNEEQSIACSGRLDVEENGFYYAMNPKKSHQSPPDKVKIEQNPIILEKATQKIRLNLFYENHFQWAGEIFYNCLSWEKNSSNKEHFFNQEGRLDPENEKKVISLNNPYLVKLFMGSLGHKVASNNFYIYYSPVGTKNNDFDPLAKRDIPGLPYGYLMGKLSLNGKIFPLGTYYDYEYNDQTAIYFLDSENNFIKLN